MGDFNLQSLLPRGTITYEERGAASTIDLTLSTERLAMERVVCDIWNHEYGSDHRAIMTYFNTEITLAEPESRLLFKHAKWKGIREDVQAGLQDLPAATDVEAYHNRLISLVD